MPEDLRHVQESLTDSLGRYLLAIYELSGVDGYARPKDIADTVGVSRPSVSAALARLSDLGMVEHQRYGTVEITQSGRSEARRLLLKHRVTQDFMERVLGLPRERAETVSADLEPSMPADLLCRLVQFTQHYQSGNREAFEWTAHCGMLCRRVYGTEAPTSCSR